MPNRAELKAALDVFRVWLEEEAIAAERTVAAAYSPLTTTLPEIAEMVGIAKGLNEAASVLEGRIESLPAE